MRIENLHIDGFGDFCDRQIGPFSRPLTVIYGPNEAGKTTLLAFIRTILFGFPRQGRDEFYPPINGGSHGGRISVSDDTGTNCVIERFAGARGGSVRITVNDEQFEDDLLLKKMLGHASRGMFESVFAFGLQELQNIKSLSESGVSARIYSAGMGAASLPSALTSLAKQREDIFRPGGSIQPVAKLLSELHEIDTELDQARSHAADYGRLIERQEAIGVELQEATKHVGRLSARKGELERLQRGWEDWARLGELETQLNELPQLHDFPPDAIVRLGAAEDRLRQANDDRTEAQEDLAHAEAAANAPVPDEGLLEGAKAVEQMRRRRGSFDDSIRDLPKRQAELRSAKGDLDKALRELGAGWDEARLASYDTSIQARDSVEQWRRSLEEQERISREATANALRAEQAAQDATAATAEARTAVDETPRPEADVAGLEQRRAALRAARTQLMRYGLAQQRREDLQFQLEQVETSPASRGGRSSAIWLVTALTGVVSIVVGLALGGAAATLGFIVGVVLEIGAAYLFVTARGGTLASASVPAESLRRRLAEAVEKEGQERDALQGCAAPFAAGIPDAEALNEIEAGLDKIAQKLQRWTVAQDGLEQRQKEEERQRKRAGEAREPAEKAREKAETEQREWREWLTERGLAETLAPETVATVFERVEGARLQLTRISEMDNRVAAIEKDIAEFRSLAEPLAAKHGGDLSGSSNADVASAVDALIERFTVAQGLATEREQARKTVEKARKGLEARKQRVSKAKTELDSLLRSGGTDDPETFRRAAQQQAERKGIEHDLRECQMRMRQLSGPGVQFDRFKEVLAATSLSGLDEEWAMISPGLSEAEEARNALYEERGGILKEIERLASDEETSERRAKRAIRVEQLRSHASDWAALTLAQELLKRARSKYEAERQPAVVKHAQGFFETLTGGRYGQLISPLGTQTVTAISRGGASKTMERLSRGTQEQLYLALRFGLIQQFSEQETYLPLVVDEILVNFDPERATYAAEAFAKVAQANQVLVFTCHPSTVELFKTIDPETPVITLAPSSAESP